MGFIITMLEDVGAKTWLIVIGCLGLSVALLAFHHTAYKQGVQTCTNAENKQVIAAQTPIQHYTSTLETETLNVQKAKGFVLPASPLVRSALGSLHNRYAARQ